MDVEVIGEPSPEDVEGLHDLLDAARGHDGHEPLGEHKWLDLVDGGRPGYAGVVVRDPGAGEIIGYAHLSAHRHTARARWGLEVVVHPERRMDGVDDLLVSKALQLAGAEGGGHLHLWVFKPSAHHDELARRHGLRRGRDLLHMRVGLPVAGGPVLGNVHLRAFEPGRDEAAWLEVNNRAFEHHPEQGAWDTDTLHRRMRESWFRPDDLLLAVDGHDLAGFCWTKILRERRTGEIYVIGVDPARQGSGLGRALVLAGLHHMHLEACTTGTLYVDAANTSAVALYGGLGFEVHHVDRAYVADVPPTLRRGDPSS